MFYKSVFTLLVFYIKQSKKSSKMDACLILLRSIQIADD
ncbi:hypothetical protein GARC_3998 [Paraglaciecola arctica BSs20135]|uniref:Uncharacterized protein n=1 Tax=Paraglaciecola arctica BSs20135 TaxID=493475 RepID=K6ZBZ6_9ALTE|nr:hypothetical protein GARC_3998 [Paraglaciecola arctica BSs20135]